MSCCGGKCGCGSGCQCGSSCNGCGKCADLGSLENTVVSGTIITGVASVNKSFEETEMSFGAENDGCSCGCKCGSNCSCGSCKC